MVLAAAMRHQYFAYLFAASSTSLLPGREINSSSNMYYVPLITKWTAIKWQDLEVI